MKKSQLRLLIKEIVNQSLLLEGLQDPTKEEMMNYLHTLYGTEEGFRDDAEVAIYWFANFYHGGQTSNLYSVLSTSRFHPGPIARGPEPRTSEEMMYEDLVIHFQPHSEEAKKFQQKHNSLNENVSLTPKNQALIEKWIKELGLRGAGVRMIDSILKNSLMGMVSADLPDTATFATGLDDIEVLLKDGNFLQALRRAAETAKEMVEEEGGEGLMEVEQHSIKDLERFAKQEKNPYVRKAMGMSQKSKTVKDFDWKRVKKGIDKGTLKEVGDDADAEMVEYVSQRQGEKPFTMKTGNGQEKFEYVNAKYPSGKVDIGVYAFRGDIVYGYTQFKKMFNLHEGKLASLSAAILLAYGASKAPMVKQFMASPKGQQITMKAQQMWNKVPQAQQTVDAAKQVWTQAMQPIAQVQDPNQPLPSEKNMTAADLAQKYADRNDDVAQKTNGFVKRYLSGEIK